MDLLRDAYDQYCDRLDAGENVNIDEYCDAFPSIRSSLIRQIEIHHYLDDEGIFDPTWPNEGEEYLGYKIVKQVGEGAYARVYKCTQPKVANRDVILKVSAPVGREVDLLGRMSHPNIVPVYDATYDESRALEAICMPFRGTSTFCTLLDKAFENDMPPKTSEFIPDIVGATDSASLPREYGDGIAHLCAQIADGLQYASDRNIVHGDIKPSNILLSGSVEPLILDFNLATDPTTKIVGGTLPYMAPEKIEALLSEGAMPDAATDRSDIYSMGVLLHHLLTGKLPFGRPSRNKDINVAATDWLARQKRPIDIVGVDSHFGRLISRCLAVDPRSRISSMAELAEELRKRMALPARFARWTYRNRLKVAVASGVLFAAAGVTGAQVASMPSVAERHIAAADAVMLIGDLPGAEVELKRALDDDPDNREIRYRLADVYLRQRKFANAMVHLKLVCEDSVDGRHFAALAYCHGQLRYHGTAKELSRRAIELGHDNSAVRNNLGRALLDLKMWKEAKEELMLATNIPEGRHNLAILALRNHQYIDDDAIENAKQLAGIEGMGGLPALRSAKILAMAGEVDLAIECFRLATARGIAEDSEELEKSPNFRNLHGHPAFSALLEEHVPIETAHPVEFYVLPDDF